MSICSIFDVLGVVTVMRNDEQLIHFTTVFVLLGVSETILSGVTSSKMLESHQVIVLDSFESADHY